MVSVIYAIGIIILSYLLGCFSTARVLAKSFKSLNIYKVGTGHPDTENIYRNVSKPLGILGGLLDSGKVYFYLFALKHIFGTFYPVLAHQKLLMIFGFAMIIGHCLPVSHKFRGGRGIFTYSGYVLFFAFWPMIIVVSLATLITVFFKQYRFSQYMIVLLPPIVLQIFTHFTGSYPPDLVSKFLLAAVLMGIINVIVSKRLGEI